MMRATLSEVRGPLGGDALWDVVMVFVEGSSTLFNHALSKTAEASCWVISLSFFFLTLG